MTVTEFTANADLELESKLVEFLQNAPEVQNVLGAPARLFLAPPKFPGFPYVMLDRHDRRPANSSGVKGAEHRLDFVTVSEYGGRQESRSILNAMRSVIESAAPRLIHQNVILLHTVYTDTMRSPRRMSFRGVMRVRAVTEAL